MNKIKFSEGGQPVYLDDLQLLQENDTSAMAKLLKMLGNGESVFLMQEFSGEVGDIDESTGTVSYTLKAGSIAVNGEMFSWKDTVIAPVDMQKSIYLCIKTEETDRRLFDDGQERACRTARNGYISQDPTGASEYYELPKIPSIETIMRKKEEEKWNDLKPSFYNGYHGNVKYKILEHSYRIWIDIKSDSSDEIKGKVNLFGTMNPVFYNFRSSCEAIIYTENTIENAYVYGVNGRIFIDKELPAHAMYCPADVPVRIVFEIPK